MNVMNLINKLLARCKSWVTVMWPRLCAFVDRVLHHTLHLEAKLFGLNAPTTEVDEEFHFAKKGMRILAYGFFGFLIWAAFFPLDKGAPASGVVVSEGNHKVVQYLNGGIVDEIFVNDGDQVKQGQILVKVNATPAQGQVNAMSESISSVQAQNEKLALSISAKKGQLRIINTQLEGLHQMDAEGYVAKNKVLDMERERLRVLDALQADQGQYDKNQGQIAELKERLGILNFDLSNTDITAPVSGTVVNLSVFTKGGVISAGGKLMEIVTADDPLVIDAQLPTQLIDKVYPDLEVEVMFPAFNQNQTPKVYGRVMTISADRLVDEKNGFPYYKIRVQVSPEGLKKLAKFNIRPGMPAEVFVKTGERSLLSYIFKPLFDRSHTALREE